MNQKIYLSELKASEIPAVVELVKLTMNQDEANWADRGISLHFDLKEKGILDGREYFTWKDHGQVKGVIGLHQYDWGPPENVWLGWFAVHPAMQRKGIGTGLFTKIVQLARQKKYHKLFVETYSDELFRSARNFYRSCGMKQVGKIQDYLPNHADMIVFKIDLD